MNVYTSYYAKAKKFYNALACVRVSVSMPSWFPMIAGELPEVYPQWELVNGLKSGAITEAEYEEEYLKKLSTISRDRIASKLTEMSMRWGGKDIVLLCWEKDGFCHRHILGQWLDMDVKELDDSMIRRF